jgi:hypothetical protein
MGRLSRGSRPSPAIVVAVLALVAALAGTALARPQATTSAISKKKVKKIATKQIKKLAPGLSVANAVNAENAASAESADRAQTVDPDATLRSGESLSGVWAVAGGMSQSLVDAVQFTPQLPAALGAGAVHRIASGGSSAQCPGPGQAAAGSLCVYETSATGVSFNVISNPGGGPGAGAGRRGAAIIYSGTATAPFAKGTWTVTAP